MTGVTLLTSRWSPLTYVTETSNDRFVHYVIIIQLIVPEILINYQLNTCPAEN